VLLLGREDGDPLFLQCKEAERSVLEQFLHASEFQNHGQRVVEGQRLMQAAGDTLLGWLTSISIDGQSRDFYVRQLWDSKTSIDVDVMTAADILGYGRMCGWTLARAHARSGDRFAIAGYLGSGSNFDDAIVRFAASYADQNERDHQRLVAAAADGTVFVTEGV
jgi:hypothetical protein